MTNLVLIDVSAATDEPQLLSAMGEQLCLGGPGGNPPMSAVNREGCYGLDTAIVTMQPIGQQRTSTETRGTEAAGQENDAPSCGLFRCRAMMRPFDERNQPR